MNGDNGANGANGSNGAAGNPGQVVPVEVEINLSEEKLAFNTGSAQIAAASLSRVTQTAQLFMKFSDSISAYDPELKTGGIKIIGQADRTGAASFNLTLSTERAAAVKVLFVQAGLDTSKIDALGIGEVKVSSCGASEKCALDRIVKIRLDLVNTLSPEATASVKQQLKDGLTAIWGK